MRQTEHYQLNQWDAEDRILREDFNHDNEKADAKLYELAQEVGKKANTDTVRAENLWVKLGETTLKSAAGQMELTAADAEKYRCFVLYFSGSGPLDIHFGINGSVNELTEASSGSFSKTALFLMGKVSIIRGGGKGVLAEGDAKLYDGEYSWGRGNSWMDRETSLSGQLSLKLIGIEKAFNADSRAVLYGLKV